MDKDKPFPTELYTFADSVWPAKGKHILATTGDNTIVVFQAYKPSIAQWVSANNTFKGCPGFSMDRMTWIKPNFLWMMYRAGWASKLDQERILAIHISEYGFNKLLANTKRRGTDSTSEGVNQDASTVVKEFGDDDVRIQWDPDHDPHGNKLERRAIQLGIRGRALQKFVEEWVVSVSDITEFVKEQYVHVQRDELEHLRIPVQRIYKVRDDNIRKHIGLDDN